MANYRVILRLHSLWTSQRGIAWEVLSFRDTIAEVIKAGKPFSGGKYNLIPVLHD